MKVEDLTQDKLDELLASIEAMQESQKGLKADLAKAKAKAKGAEIDPEEHAALQTKVEELSNELSKATGNSKKEIDKLTAQLQEKDGALNTYLIEAGLTDALAKAGVKPEFMDASKALLKAQAVIKAENGQYQALIGEKPLADAIKEWAVSETGKHFVAAPANSGGGSQGGGGNGGNQNKGKIDGTTAERAAYFATKFPELQKE
jgi:alanyl-tRNA synthetase